MLIHTSPRQRFAVGIVFLSLVCHGLGAWSVFLPVQSFRIRFPAELLFLIVLSTAGSLLAFFVRARHLFRAIHIVRLFLLFVALRIVGSRFLALELLLIAPFLAEWAVYEALRPGLALNALATGAVLVGAVVDLRTAGHVQIVWHAGVVALVSGAVTATFCLLSYYRERIVHSERAAAQINEAFEKLSDANLALQLYAMNAESEAARQERNRVTRDLHDTMGYGLSNIIMTMNAARVLLKDGSAGLDELVENARGVAEECLRDTRRTLYQLRAITEPALRGIRALAHLVAVFRKATGVDIELRFGNSPWSFGETVDGVLYRLVQEGLVNAFRHGQATHVRILLWRKGDRLRVVISDNGRGVKSLQQGIGLSGMRERIQELGGSIEPHNRADGFELSAEIPLGRRTADA